MARLQKRGFLCSYGISSGRKSALY